MKDNYTNVREYADWIITKLPKFGMIPFIGNNIVSGHDGLLAVQWHKKGQFMTQLYIAKPNMILPKHKHPNVDDINIILGGQIHGAHKGKWTLRALDKSKINELTGESIDDSNWFKLATIQPSVLDVWKEMSDQLPNPYRLSQYETKAGDSHGVQFGPGGGCMITCQHWLDGKPTCIMDDNDVEVIQPQENLTWKDVAYKETEDWQWIKEENYYGK